MWMILVGVLAQLQPLPPTLVALDSDEGRRMLVASRDNHDFFALVGTYETQREASYCGVASAVAVLNALPLAAPTVVGPFRGFTEDNVFNEEARRASLTSGQVASGGLTIAQLAGLLRANHAGAEPRFAAQASVEDFRREASAAVGDADHFVLVDFFRGELGQDTGAHWSPLAAYDAASDRFLVLDVARFRYRPYWARTEDLFRAMNTADLDSGKSRGWLVVSAAPGAPGRIAIAPIGHRILLYGIAAALVLFLAGAAAGALVARWRMRATSSSARRSR